MLLPAHPTRSSRWTGARAGLLATALVAGLAASACTNETFIGTSKNDARLSGGRDRDGNDLCERYRWYGDGECDDFCLRRDPDCGTARGRSCGGLTAAPNGCAPDEFCDWAPGDFCGAADAPGVCRKRPTGDCGGVYAPVCGCDGQTYANACVANSAGVSVAAEGECDAPEGRSCGGLVPPGTQAQCDPEEFCDYAPEDFCGAADAPGVCRPRPTVCDDIYDPVCGCDGQTYANACEANAAGTSVAAEGACDAPKGRSCGGLVPPGTEAQCDPEEFCDYAPEDFCGAADAPGVCRPRPQACDAVYDPVCGCDGKTYDNACAANAAGTSVSSLGACPQ